MSLVQQMMLSLSTTNDKFKDLEQKFTNLSIDSSSLAPDSKVLALEKEVTDLRAICAPDSKVQSLEQDISDLRVALPARKAPNKPSITDISIIQLPVRPQFELASKTVKLKDLVNSLNSLSFSSDEIKDIKHTYSQIRQAVDIGCATSALLPDIDNATSVPDFLKELVRPITHKFMLLFWLHTKPSPTLL